MRLGLGVGVDFLEGIAILGDMASPSGLTATPTGIEDVKLDWVDNEPNEDNYEVERSNDGIIWASLIILAADTITYTDTTTINGNAYYYRVKATSATLEDSDYSNVVFINLGAAASIGTAIIETDFQVA